MLGIIIDQLKDKGLRITPQRRAILEIIVSAPTLKTVAEIWHEVQGEYPDIGLDTVYRNLNMLVDMGVLIPIVGVGKSPARYELAAAAHHHHIICIKCGATTCLDFCPIDPQFIVMLRRNGYELVRHNVELFGLCSECR